MQLIDAYLSFPGATVTIPQVALIQVDQMSPVVLLEMKLALDGEIVPRSAVVFEFRVGS